MTGSVDLAMMAKAPLPGIAKTRLAASIGASDASLLAAALLEDSLWAADSAGGQTRLVAPDAAQVAELRTRFPGRVVSAQPTRGLAAGIAGAIEAGLASGHSAVLVIGSDHPDLPPHCIADAMTALRTADAVVAPTADGGYWAIGSRVPLPILTTVELGGASAFAATVAALEAAGLTVAIGPAWQDVDTLADLEALGARLLRQTGHVARATRRVLAGLDCRVVIPVWNEREAITALLAELDPLYLPRTVVVDGGSRDGTPEAARAAGATVIRQPARGYGDACYAGVEWARTGRWVAFLDGDYSDPPSALDALLAPLAAGEADLMLGNRHVARGIRHPLPVHARAGNELVTRAISWRTGVRVRDLPSMKALATADLCGLGMREMSYGWTTELIARAAARHWRVESIEIDYRPRHGGHSKVSGSVRASAAAATALLRAAWRYSAPSATQPATHEVA